jgi:hypothetical protein
MLDSLHPAKVVEADLAWSQKQHDEEISNHYPHDEDESI